MGGYGGSGLLGIISGLVGNFAQARRQEHLQRMDYELKQMNDLSLIAFPEKFGLPADAFDQGMQTRARDQYFKLLNSGLGSKETKAQAAEIQNIVNVAAPMRAAMAQRDRTQGGTGHLPDSPRGQAEARAQGAQPSQQGGLGFQTPQSMNYLPAFAGTNAPAQQPLPPQLGGPVAVGATPAILSGMPQVNPPAAPTRRQMTAAGAGAPTQYKTVPDTTSPTASGAFWQPQQPTPRQGTPASTLAPQGATLPPSVAATGQQPQVQIPAYTPPLVQPGKEPRGGVLGALKSIGQGIGQSVTGAPRNVMAGYPTPPPTSMLGLTPDQAMRQRYQQAIDLGASSEEAAVYATTGKMPAPSRAAAREERGIDREITLRIAALGPNATDTQKAAAVQQVLDEDAARKKKAAGAGGGLTGDPKIIAEVEAKIAEDDDIINSNDPKVTQAQKDRAQEDKINQAAILEKKTGILSPLTAPPSYKKGAPSIANPGMDQGVENDSVAYLMTGKMPTYGSSGAAAGTKIRLSRRAGEITMNWGLTAEDIPALRAISEADKKTFAKINDMDSAVGQLEGTLANNMAIAEKLNDAYARSDFPFVNELLSSIISGTGGTVAQNLGAQLHAVALEWAKIMEGSTMSARGVNVTSAEEAEKIIKKDASSGQLRSLFNLIRQDAEARRGGIDQQKTTLIERLRHPETMIKSAEGTAAAGARKGGDEASGPNITKFNPQKSYNAKQRQVIMQQYVTKYGDETTALQKMAEDGWPVKQ